MKMVAVPKDDKLRFELVLKVSPPEGRGRVLFPPEQAEAGARGLDVNARC